jgi:hypothetical protein
MQDPLPRDETNCCVEALWKRLTPLDRNSMKVLCSRTPLSQNHPLVQRGLANMMAVALTVELPVSQDHSNGNPANAR